MRKTAILSAALAASLMLNALLLTSTSGQATTVTGIPVAPASAPAPAQADAADWGTFIRALAWVESRWDDHAVSSKGAAGYLQVMPVLVEDANRICGQDTFSLEGRFDREESVRLFNVIMDEYNPEHDLHLALKLWNPYAKVSYHRAVIRKYRTMMELRSAFGNIVSI